jgi:hypothetical protein
VVDVHDAVFDVTALLERAKSLGVPALAFGRHTEPAALRAARDAGASIVVPRSKLVEELPTLLQRVLSSEAPTESDS